MDFDEYLKEKMQHPEFRREWEASEPAARIIRMLVGARSRMKWTRLELARRMGVDFNEIRAAEETGEVSADFMHRFEIAVHTGEAER
jgi:hypothetical protein